MPRPTIEQLNEAKRRSGNLGGRPRKPSDLRVAEAKLAKVLADPKQAEARKAKLEEMAPKALLRLDELLDSGSERVRLNAVQDVLDRYYGRPTQRVESEDRSRELREASPEQLRSELRRRLRLLEGSMLDDEPRPEASGTESG